MRNLMIIGFAVGTLLGGCASKSGARSEPTTSAATATATAPAHQRAQGDGDHEGMMAGSCPMQVPGTTVAAVDVEGGIGLSFMTTTGDVAELRKRARRMAEMHNQHKMMPGHGAPTPGADAEHEHGARAGAGHEGGDRAGVMKGGMMKGGMMKGDGMKGGMMKMPAAIASAEDIEGGARLILQPKDPARLGALREHVRMKAQRMAGGECPMMSHDSGGEPAPANPADPDHDDHH